MANTGSWLGVQRLIRTRLLGFTSISGGSSLATLIGSTTSGSGSDGKIFLNQAPDDVTGFWAILRVIDDPKDGADGRLMIRATAELQLFGRPRRVQAQVEAMADLVEEAWMNFSHTEIDGHLSAMGVSNRFAVPYESDPADRELVQVRLLLYFRCVPQFLLKYAN